MSCLTILKSSDLRFQISSDFNLKSQSQVPEPQVSETRDFGDSGTPICSARVSVD